MIYDFSNKIIEFFYGISNVNLPITVADIKMEFNF